MAIRALCGDDNSERGGSCCLMMRLCVSCVCDNCDKAIKQGEVLSGQILGEPGNRQGAVPQHTQCTSTEHSKTIFFVESRHYAVQVWKLLVA